MKVKVPKTYTARPSDLKPQWHRVDASGKVLGKLAAQVAHLLQGKHRPTYTPHLPAGDWVVVVNATQVRVTGRKMRQKFYYSHSGYPGGLRQFPLEQMLKRDPVRVIKRAIWGMLPKNALGKRLLRRLKVYPGPQHPHGAQLAPSQKG